MALQIVLFTMGACGRETPQPPVDSAAAVAATSPIAWSFDVPKGWDERVKLTDTVPGSGTYRSARMFFYTPRDTTIVRQALLGIFVYDSVAWAAIVKEGGPPMGDSLTSANGKVFIASLPQSNPFAEGTADWRAFDSLTVDLEAVKRGFKVAR